MNISGIKTREDALAAIDAFQAPSPVADPAPLKDGASEAQKTAHAVAVEDVKKRNAFIAREAGLISAVKELAKARINAVNPDVKVIGIEVRADTGPIELIAIRIIEHK